MRRVPSSWDLINDRFFARYALLKSQSIHPTPSQNRLLYGQTLRVERLNDLLATAVTLSKYFERDAGLWVVTDNVFRGKRQER